MTIIIFAVNILFNFVSRKVTFKHPIAHTLADVLYPINCKSVKKGAQQYTRARRMTKNVKKHLAAREQSDAMFESLT